MISLKSTYRDSMSFRGADGGGAEALGMGSYGGLTSGLRVPQEELASALLEP